MAGPSSGYTLSVMYCAGLRGLVRESWHPLREIFVISPRASPLLSAMSVLTLTIFRASILRFSSGPCDLTLMRSFLELIANLKAFKSDLTGDDPSDSVPPWLWLSG